MKFEIAVFNEIVRDTVRSGEDYIGFIPLKYESMILHELYATSMDDAIKRSEAKWPSDAGYVIESLRSLND